MLENNSGFAEFYGGVRRSDGHGLDHGFRRGVDCLCQDSAGPRARKSQKTRGQAGPLQRENGSGVLGEKIAAFRRLLGWDVGDRLNTIEGRLDTIETSIEQMSKEL